MTDTAFETPPGASVWEHSMLSYMKDHVLRERAMLEEYAAAAEHTESKALAYVIRILLEDEERHHRWFLELASSLKTEASLSGDDPAIPWLDLHRIDHAKLNDPVALLMDHEKDDAKELKRLRKELKDMEHTTLWGLLVELMQRDTDKHIAILQFVQRHSKPL